MVILLVRASRDSTTCSITMITTDVFTIIYKLTFCIVGLLFVASMLGLCRSDDAELIRVCLIFFI